MNGSSEDRSADVDQIGQDGHGSSYQGSPSSPSSALNTDAGVGPVHAQDPEQASLSPPSATYNPYLILSDQDQHLLSISLPPPATRPISSPISAGATGTNTEWGLPADPGSSQEHLVSNDLRTRLSHFHQLKAADVPTHFNASLLNNRSFRNPSIYDQIVALIGVDERASGYALVQGSRRQQAHEQLKKVASSAAAAAAAASSSSSTSNTDEKSTSFNYLLSWNNTSLSRTAHSQADPRRLANLQKVFTDQQQAKQSAGKRSTIDFTPAHNGGGARAGVRGGGGSSNSSGSGVGGGGVGGGGGGGRLDQIKGQHSSSSTSSATSTPTKRKQQEEGPQRHGDRVRGERKSSRSKLNHHDDREDVGQHQRPRRKEQEW